MLLVISFNSKDFISFFDESHNLRRHYIKHFIDYFMNLIFQEVMLQYFRFILSKKALIDRMTCGISTFGSIPY